MTQTTLSVYISPDFEYLLLDREAVPFADDIRINGTDYRIASPRWLAWLRNKFADVRKTVTGEAMQKLHLLRTILEEHDPGSLNSQTKLPANYEPPNVTTGDWLEI